jgi:hypothetical protein
VTPIADNPQSTPVPATPAQTPGATPPDTGGAAAPSTAAATVTATTGG